MRLTTRKSYCNYLSKNYAHARFLLLEKKFKVVMIVITIYISECRTEHCIYLALRGILSYMFVTLHAETLHRLWWIDRSSYHIDTNPARPNFILLIWQCVKSV